MSDHIIKTIEQAKGELRKNEEAIVNTKRMINQLCAFAGIPPEYQDADLQISGTGTGGISIRRNMFFGKPLATCVREYLEMRKDRMPVKEATLDEIISALEEGGFDLDRISTDKDDARRGVAITLAKNPQFHRLPNNDWGLLVWYPGVKRGKESKANGGDSGKDEQQEEQETAGAAPSTKLKTPEIFTTEGGPV